MKCKDVLMLLKRNFLAMMASPNTLIGNIETETTACYIHGGPILQVLLIESFDCKPCAILLLS